MTWRRQSANISKGITGYKLIKAIGEYLASGKAEEIIRNVFKQAELSENSPNLTPRARTARGWLNNSLWKDWKRSVYRCYTVYPFQQGPLVRWIALMGETILGNASCSARDVVVH